MQCTIIFIEKLVVANPWIYGTRSSHETTAIQCLRFRWDYLLGVTVCI